MKPFLQRHHLCLTPLSPLHLGSGEDYEPTNYVIKDNLLYAFDPSQAVLTMAEQKELLAASRSCSLQTIQKFFAQNPDPFTSIAVSISGVSEALAQEYKDKIGHVVQREGNKRNVLNQLQIERTTTHPQTHQPYIPGSALKGCLRTALMETKSEKQAPQNKLEKKWAQLAYETELLGKFANDLLRLLKPADLMATADIATHVQYATKHKKRAVVINGQIQRGGGLTGRRETIQHGQYRAFSGDCVMQHLDLSHKPVIKKADKNIPKELQQNLSELAKIANRYHRRRFDKESKILKGRNLVDERWLGSVQQLLDKLQPFMDSGKIMLLRLGKNGGAESKTLEKYARIKIMGKKGQPSTEEKETKTVWLAAPSDKADSNLLPFGWALIEIDPQADNPALQTWCRDNSAHLPDISAIRERLQQEKALQAEKEAEIARAAAEKAEQAQKAQQAAQAEAERLAQLPEEERNIHTFINKLKEIGKTIKGAGDEKAVEAYKALLQLIETIRNNPDLSLPQRRKLADMLSISAVEKYCPHLLSKKRKIELKAELSALRGEE